MLAPFDRTPVMLRTVLAAVLDVDERVSVVVVVVVVDMDEVDTQGTPRLATLKK